MNLNDPKFAAQVRKVTIIFSIAAMVLSVFAGTLSLYTLHLAREREAVWEVITHPLRYPAEMREVECMLEGELRVEPKAFCAYLGGEVTPPR